MASRLEVIECHMAKFCSRVDGSGEFSIYGLNSRDVPEEALLDREQAKAWILGNCWLGMFDAIGEHSATLLLQLWISSGGAMFDIVTLLFLSENVGEGNGWQLDSPSYDNLKVEIDAWLRSVDDAWLASRISYAAWNFYENYGSSASNDIGQLKRCIMVGFGLLPVPPFMDGGQIDVYNAIIAEDSIYRLRAHADFADLLYAPDVPAGEPDVGEGKSNGRLLLALGFMAAVLYALREKGNKAKEPRNDSENDAGIE